MNQIRKHTFFDFEEKLVQFTYSRKGFYAIKEYFVRKVK